MWLTRHHPSVRTEKRSYKKTDAPARPAAPPPEPPKVPEALETITFENLDLIRVGQVRKPREDGWVHIKIHTDHPERFSVGSELLAETAPGRGVAVKVVESRDSGPADEVEVQLLTVESGKPCNPDPVRGLYVERRKRLPAPRGSYYPDELEGMAVEDEQGTTVGRVIRLEAETPAPYLVIHTDQHGELLIPYHRQFVAQISRDRRRIKLSGPIEQHVQE